jgi:hypothetical protein
MKKEMEAQPRQAQVTSVASVTRIAETEFQLTYPERNLTYLHRTSARNERLTQTGQSTDLACERNLAKHLATRQDPRKKGKKKGGGEEPLVEFAPWGMAHVNLLNI